VPADHFGEDVAPGYDEAVAPMFAPSAVDPAVDFLAELANGGPALELGIGTGRIALPLMAKGVPVHGIDLSSAMVGELRRKPGGADIPVTLGDFATATVDEAFSLVYLVFNTIMNLTTQAEQVACFRNAARHLQPGGRFVVEVSVPDLQRLPRGELYRPFTVDVERLGFDEYDVVNQGLISHHYRLENGGLRLRSFPFRYVWPAELDLMAQLAGMALEQRWGDWDRCAFTAQSERHVSVWAKR
jgi:SAM-dependent methyltransferase